MFGRRNGQIKSRSLFSILNKALMIIMQDIRFHQFICLNGPVITVRIAAEPSEIGQSQVMSLFVNVIGHWLLVIKVRPAPNRSQSHSVGINF